jgi:hypothetical protein
MEIALVVVGAWVLLSLSAALLIGRFLRVADRRERATTITASGMPKPARETARAADAAEVHESA